MEKGLFEMHLKAVLLKLPVVKEEEVFSFLFFKKISKRSLTNTFIKNNKKELLGK